MDGRNGGAVHQEPGIGNEDTGFPSFPELFSEVEIPEKTFNLGDLVVLKEVIDYTDVMDYPIPVKRFEVMTISTFRFLRPHDRVVWELRSDVVANSGEFVFA